MRRPRRPTPTRASLACTAWLAGVLGLALPGVAAGAAEDAAGSGAAALEALRGAMDPEADPCQDFYRFACGGWQDAVQRPPHEPSYLRSFTELRLHSREVRRDALERAQEAGRPEGGFFASCMDEATVESRGAEPLAPHLEEIARVEDLEGLFRSAGRLQRLRGVGPLTGLFVGRDKKAPDTWLVTLIQGGMGLPERSYYLAEETAPLREAYQAHVSRLLELAGQDADAAQEDAAQVLALETRLAESARSRTELRDAELTYRREDLAGLQALDPSLPWPAFFEGMGHAPPAVLNVATPEFVQGLGRALAQSPPEAWRAYLRAHLLFGSADLLSEPFVHERFAFRAALTGQAAQRPRWQRCVDATTRAFPERVGRGFVEAAFAGDSKARALAMVSGVEKAFEATLPEVAWMDEPTREAALAKAGKVGNRIGHPDRWREEDIAVEEGRWFENASRATAFEVDRDLERAGQPVDPEEWQVAASLVNAFYSPTGNEMVFPAGILQPPFFHRKFPEAMNYGAIGAVVGHELTHGFDDQGRKYDGSGRLRPWWPEPVAERFEARAQCLVEQYDAFEAQPGAHVNGRLTLGENIADLGGLKAAHRAFRATPEAGAEASAVDGLTPDQLFFVAFGQVWCADTAPQYEQMMLRVDPHSPARFRVNGTLRNLPAFGEAFACEVGAPLRPAEACEVW